MKPRGDECQLMCCCMCARCFRLLSAAEELPGVSLNLILLEHVVCMNVQWLKNIVLNCIDDLTSWIDLSMCENSGRGDGLRVCSPKVITSHFGKRCVFLKSAPLARVCLFIAHSFASS